MVSGKNQEFNKYYFPSPIQEGGYLIRQLLLSKEVENGGKSTHKMSAN